MSFQSANKILKIIFMYIRLRDTSNCPNCMKASKAIMTPLITTMLQLVKASVSVVVFELVLGW